MARRSPTPVSHQDSSLLANLSRADALIIRPPHAPAAAAGSPCKVLKLPRLSEFARPLTRN